MNHKTIFITGISSGIGLSAADFFLKQGHTVVGTARTTEAFADFKTYSNFKGLILDLKDKLQIEQIGQSLIQIQISKIDVLINNAGVAIAGPFADQDFLEIEEMVQVNVLALMRITQKLIPLLQKPGGRIINISSVSGQNGTPFLSAYCASKHAVEGFSEAIRRELLLLGIKVILVGPGSIKTPIWFKGFGKLKVRYTQSAFAKSFDRFVDFALNEEKNALPVLDVVRDLEQAAFSEFPKIRYAPIPRKFRNYYLGRLIPKRMMDHLTAKALLLNR